MNPLTREWVEKAEGDLVTAARELRARKSPNYDAACFHAQQCAEKYLKAVLHAEAISFARTHNMAALLDMVLPLEPSWEMMPGATAALFAAVPPFDAEHGCKQRSRGTRYHNVR
ncbi:MAG: HEPN domain-containing protein [Planctomycetota bacterium]|nr:HEPN domain-containing protein [Planctomycetota bacterium]